VKTVAYFRVLRTRHWIKNLFVLAAPFFGGTLFHDRSRIIVIPVFVAFCLCASASYIINDIIDMRNDNHHPEKKLRPIAAGDISRGAAAAIAALLAVVSFCLAYRIGLVFLYFVCAYFLLQAAYSFYLKHIPLVDIFCISAGFIIRITAGGAAFHVEVSRWLLLTMFMISIVLAIGKRGAEVMLLNGNAANHRKSLRNYSQAVMNEILIISSSASLIAYSLYTVEQSPWLVYTVPVVTFGLFRYLMVSRQGLGDPTEAVTGDKWLALTVAVWLLLAGFMSYNKPL